MIQPQYTPFQQAQTTDYAMQGNPLSPQKGLIGGLVNSLLGTYTLGLTGNDYTNVKDSMSQTAPASVDFAGGMQQAAQDVPQDLWSQFQNQYPTGASAVSALYNGLNPAPQQQQPQQQGGWLQSFFN